MAKNYRVLHGSVGRFAQGDVITKEHLDKAHPGADLDRLRALGAVEETDDKPFISGDNPAFTAAYEVHQPPSEAELKAVPKMDTATGALPDASTKK